MSPLLFRAGLQVKKNHRRAFTLVELLVVVAIFGVLMALLVTAVQKVREMALRTECQNRLKQAALALHSFHNQHKSFPPALSTVASDYWYLSWMGRILPFIEQDALGSNVVPEYQRVYSPWGYFWLPGWGGQPPHEALSQTVDNFKCPAEGRELILKDMYFGNGNFTDTGFATYLGVNGTDGAAGDGVLVAGPPVRLNDIADGTSTTLLIGERPPTKDLWYGMWYAGAGYDGKGSGDVVLGARETAYAAALGCPNSSVGLKGGRIYQVCDQGHFWSLHWGGAHFALADGSVRFLSYSADPLLPALATRSGAEALSDF